MYRKAWDVGLKRQRLFGRLSVVRQKATEDGETVIKKKKGKEGRQGEKGTWRGHWGGK